jgi:hypothetical protein
LPTRRVAQHLVGVGEVREGVGVGGRVGVWVTFTGETPVGPDDVLSRSSRRDAEAGVDVVVGAGFAAWLRHDLVSSARFGNGN